MSKETNDFISSLKEYNSENLRKNVYVPSLEQSISFLPMTARHQKYIIESTMDNPIYNAVFQQKIYNIVSELCEDTNLVDSFTVYDKDAILIQLRYHFINDKYNDKPLEPVVSQICKFKENLTPKEDKVDGFRIVYKIPSMKDEKRIYSQFQKSKQYTISPTDDDEIRGMIANMYILELCKYVETITIESKELSMTFPDHSIEECMEIIDNIGKPVVNKIQDYINDLRNQHEAFYKLDEEENIVVNSDLFS